MNLFRLFIHILLLSYYKAICYCSFKEPSAYQFGRSMRKYFFLEPNFIQMNHASFGTYPNVVYKSLRDFQVRCNRNPDLWMKRDVLTELAKIRTQLGKLLSADSDDLVIVPNTTSGITAVLRSWLFKAGDRILHFSTIYDAIEGVVRFIVDRNNGNVSTVVFNVTYPSSNEDMLTRFEQFLNQVHTPNKPITMALVDHVSSMPTVVMPIDKILPMLHKRNIVTLVDAAHAYGQLPINLTAFNPDFYVTNGHKWGYVCRGTAILYVKKKHQGIIHPVTPSRYYRDPSQFQKEFYWTGTIDFSAYMTFPAALKFRQEIGGEEAIMAYNHKLALEGGNYLAKRFGTRLLQQVEDQIGSMADIQLPVNNPKDPKLSGDWWMDQQLYTAPGTYTPVYFHNGQWWTRTSAQVYMDITDYEVHAIHLLTICNKLNGHNGTSTTVVGQWYNGEM